MREDNTTCRPAPLWSDSRGRSHRWGSRSGWDRRRPGESGAPCSWCSRGWRASWCRLCWWPGRCRHLRHGLLLRTPSESIFSCRRLWLSGWTPETRNVPTYFLVSMSAECLVRRAPSLYQAIAGGGTALLVTLHFSFRSAPADTFLLRGDFSWALETGRKELNVR